MTILIYPVKVKKLPFKNYCYLVVNKKSKEALLIDPAWEIDKIESIVNLHQVVLTGILLTHHHFDHVNLAEPLAHKYQVPVRMSRIEIDYYNFSCHNLIPIEQHDTLILAQIKVECLYTPGHTKGAISYWIENALFSGDTLFIEGCGACFDKGSDPNSMFESLRYLKTIIPLDTLIFPGHSYGEEPGKKFSYLLQNNIYLQLANRDEFITFRMRPNQKALLSFI